MPQDWVPAARFMTVTDSQTHEEIEIYHIYREDCFQSGAREYWFWFDDNGSEYDDTSFDVRELLAWKEVGRDSPAAVFERAAVTGELLALRQKVYEEADL